jgi:adenosylmethionine-8-amino-7-oxononanoate aminotransferase
VHRAREEEAWFHGALSTLTDHPLVAEVRGGVGFMAAVILDPDLLAQHPEAAGAFWWHTREAGLTSRGLYEGLALAPPLTITADELDYAVQALRRGLDAVN